MSLVLITKHNENIYDLTKKSKIFFKKSPRYVSKKRDMIKANLKTNVMGKLHHATMGRPEEILPDPANYLKKRTGQLSYSQSKSIEPKLTIVRKEKVPTLTECLEQYKRPITSTNFVVSNIKHAIKMKTKDPTPKIVLERFGESHPLSRGLEPVFIKSDGFGKMPKYLVRFVKTRAKLSEKQKSVEAAQQPICRYVTKDEREKLLNGLKKNWEELQKQYQVLPMLTDTIPKINRKIKLEDQLKELEKDIVIVEKHPYIYVYEDEDISQI